MNICAVEKQIRTLESEIGDYCKKSSVPAQAVEKNAQMKAPAINATHAEHVLEQMVLKKNRLISASKSRRAN